jgi:hypothetical protein
MRPQLSKHCVWFLLACMFLSEEKKWLKPCQEEVLLKEKVMRKGRRLLFASIESART